MSDLMFKNGNLKKVKKKTKINKGNCEFIMKEINHPIVGKFYLSLTPKYYKKCNNILSSSIKYNFLDGTTVDDDDYDDIWVNYQYEYPGIDQLISKLTEIEMSEYILNDNFWIYDSYYCYIFSILNVKYNINGNKKKFKSISKFFKSLNIHKTLFSENTVFSIDTENNKYKKMDISKVKGEKKEILVQLYPNIYFPIKSSIFKNTNITIKSKVRLIEEDFTVNSREDVLGAERVSRNDLARLLESYFSKYVVEGLESNYQDGCYKIRLKVTSLNNKKLKSTIPIKKFILKYFKGV